MTFTVTNASDSGAGSLRQAILDSNANPPPPNTTNLIQFNIPGSGVHTIALASSLPDINQSVIIDGYTQPGASANTLAIGDNAVLLIRIDGGTVAPIMRLCDPATCGGSGFSSDGSTIKGLCIVQQSGGGNMLNILSNNDLVAGNFIGVDTDGVTLGGFSPPVNISLVSGNVIGGTLPAARNVMATNNGALVDILGGNTLVQGNYLGVNAPGTAALGLAGTGVIVELGNGTTVGGSASGAGNVINARVRDVQVGIGAPNNNTTIQGNLIGTDATGTYSVADGSGTGILVDFATINSTIGGSAPGAGNLISGTNLGIEFSGTGTIQGNKIGTDITGTAAIGNATCGIVVWTDDNSVAGPTIGGTNPGEGNIIAFNGSNGVVIQQPTGGWAILGNSIFSNGALGITLAGICGAVPPRPNDHCDADNLQNYPVITSASFSGGNVTLSGTLDSVPNTTFRIEFFSSASCDPSGFGEGQNFLGSTNVTTDGSCTASFGPLTFSLPAGDTVATATATILDGSGNPIETSEFSACAVLPIPTGAVSRKTHGGAGDFDVNLPLTGTPGVECRTGGATNDYTMVVTFGGNVIVTGNPQAQVTMGTATIGSGGVGNGGMVMVNGNVVTIPLTLVANVQTINVRLNGVNGGSDAPATDVDIPMSVLIADVNGNRVVNASDVALTKSKVGMQVGSGNFREDVNASGTITATDVTIVKSHVGTSLPP